MTNLKMPTTKDIPTMHLKNLKELKLIAKHQKLKGYSKLRKLDLIDKIVLDILAKKYQPSNKKDRRYFNSKTYRELKSIAENEYRIYIKGQPLKENLISSILEAEELRAEKLSRERKIRERELRQQIKLKKSALNKSTEKYSIVFETKIDLNSFLDEVEPKVIEFLNNNRNKKIQFSAKCVMKLDDKLANIYFNSKQADNLSGTDVNELYKKAKQEIIKNMEAFQNEGSGWVYDRIINLDIITVHFKPLKGKSYIPLPKEIASKKAIINIKNNDNECFKWCITRALNDVEKNPERITNELKKQSEQIKWNVRFPTPVNDIDKFENQYKNLAINVYGLEDGNIYPIRISKKADGEKIKNIDLLLISDGDKSHYCIIKSLSRLLSSQIYKGGHKVYICRRCLNSFRTEDKLIIHREYCLKNKPNRIVLPDKNSTLSFKNYNHSMKVPFTIYADFESFIKAYNSAKVYDEDKESYTKQYKKHTPSSFVYYVKCFDNSISTFKPVVKIAENENDDIAQAFVKCITEEVKSIYNLYYKYPKKMIFNEDDKINFNNANKCYICEEEFKNSTNTHIHIPKRKYNKEDKKSYNQCSICDEIIDEYTKVRDHCHFTGKFRGAAHNSCNLNYKKPKFIPVVMHNLSGYDCHLFIKKLGSDKENIKCIPNTDEKYISFSKDVVVDEYMIDGKEIKSKMELRFIDSYRFMPSSLDSLIQNLVIEKCKDCTKFNYNCVTCKQSTLSRGRKYCSNLFQHFSDCTDEQILALLRKGIYPYEYMDSVERLHENKLPPKEVFYSSIKLEGVTDDDYNHALKVWDLFNCKTMRDYHKLYNICDVLLLADIFENFRNTCMNTYKLDPLWYYTAPGLSWNAMLKMTKIKLELLYDIDMLNMVKQGIRGGISTVTHRYAKANNKYMNNYDKTKESIFIEYLDANNLYGWAMSKSLPTHGFEWMSEDELKNWDNMKNGIGCILEVDLKYPIDKHNLHNEYPLAPEMLQIDKVKKLVPNLNNKIKYVLHYENLKLYLRLGLELTKIHRGIKFYERDWMKQYIDLNTELRKKAKNEFEKDFFKLMNNSVFGKTMENIEKHVDIRLISDEAKVKKLAVKPNFERVVIFDENLVAMHMYKTKLVYNKPIYLGMCILDISKTLMYDFHYNYIKAKYKDKSKLLFTDTDSLMYEIKTEDFFDDIKNDVDSRFDTSNYNVNHKLLSMKNKAVIGMFKDEAGGKQIEEFVGLRSKLYSYILNGGDIKKCKGITKAVIKKSIHHKDYLDCLHSGIEQYRTMNIIGSKKHDVYCIEVKKVALSSNDDKRVIQSDGINTLAIGNFKINDKK